MAKRARINDLPVLITNPVKSDVDGFIYFWVIGSRGIKRGHCYSVPETMFNSKEQFEYEGNRFINSTID